MTSWTEHLNTFRRRELEIAFAGCPPKAFRSILELGAGSGFQSRLLTAYTDRLVSTDLNDQRLQQIDTPGIEYRICDAEHIETVCEEHAYDLVFASNLFEHLPSPQAGFRGITYALAPGGVVILVMPNVLWKWFSLLGFYPNMLRNLIRALQQGRVQALWKKYSTQEKTSTPVDAGNNIKSKQSRSRLAGIVWPVPHGAYATHMEELHKYGKKRWKQEFTKAGFALVAIRKGPVSSGYGFGLDWGRHMLERWGIATEYIYVLTRRGEASPFAQYWHETQN